MSRLNSSRTRDCAADDERALELRRLRAPARVGVGDRAKEVVERADRSREERGGAPNQVALDAIDVDAIRHDEPRVTRDLREIALEQERDLAGMRRPHDQRETH